MSRNAFLLLCVALLFCVAFNTLWVVRPSAAPTLWQALALSVNAAFLMLIAAGVMMARRSRRRVAGLRRTAQRLELRVDDQDREARVLETISSVSTSFLNNVQIQTLLRQMSDAVRRILGAEAAVVELLGEPGVLDPVTLASGLAGLQLGSAVHDTVVAEGKSLLLNDLGHYPRFAELHTQGLRAMVAAPFKRGGGVIGLIGAFRSSGRPFTGHDLSMLLTFATHTSLLVEGAALLDACRRLSLRTGADQVDDLRHLRSRLSFQREASDRESAVARRIQSELLPREFPKFPAYSLDAIMLPAREVGGDFYDVIPVGTGAWGVAIADVAGKGVPAALVMVMARTLLRAAVLERPSPRQVLLQVNRELFEQTTGDVFVSLFYGVWDDASRTLRYANAGHEPPLLVRDHRAEFLPRGGIALGAYDEIDTFLTEGTVQLAPTDALLLYTDGAREAMNPQSEMYGLERLRATAARAVAERRALIAVLREDIQRFVADAEQHDDVTLLALQGH